MGILEILFIIVTLLLVIGVFVRDERFSGYNNVLVVIDLVILGYVAFAGGR